MWSNSENAWINYIQGVIPDNPTLGGGGCFNTEGATTEWRTINGCEILRIEDDELVIKTADRKEFGPPSL